MWSNTRALSKCTKNQLCWLDIKPHKAYAPISESYTAGVATTRLGEVSGAARRLQKVLLQIDKKYYFSVICISDK
jgi:hypothetical protein